MKKECTQTYDEIVNATFVNIFTLTKDSDEIILNNFNINNETHLYFLAVAQSAATVFNKTAIVLRDTPIYKIGRYRKKLKMKNLKRKPSKENMDLVGIDIDDVLIYMRKEIGFPFRFYTNIYNLYYAEEERR